MIVRFHNWRLSDMRKKSFIFTFMLFCLAGCAPWPHAANGGGAEIDLVIPPENSHLNSIEKDQLQRRLLLTHYKLEALKSEGFTGCFPGLTEEAQLQTQRVTRDLIGGLEKDAYNELITLEHQINALQKKAQSINKQTCIAKSLNPQLKEKSSAKLESSSKDANTH